MITLWKINHLGVDIPLRYTFCNGDTFPSLRDGFYYIRLMGNEELEK